MTTARAETTKPTLRLRIVHDNPAAKSAQSGEPRKRGKPSGKAYRLEKFLKLFKSGTI